MDFLDLARILKKKKGFWWLCITSNANSTASTPGWFLMHKAKSPLKAKVAAMTSTLVIIASTCLALLPCNMSCLALEATTHATSVRVAFHVVPNPAATFIV